MAEEPDVEHRQHDPYREESAPPMIHNASSHAMSNSVSTASVIMDACHPAQNGIRATWRDTTNLSRGDIDKIPSTKGSSTTNSTATTAVALPCHLRPVCRTTVGYKTQRGLREHYVLKHDWDYERAHLEAQTAFAAIGGDVSPLPFVESIVPPSSINSLPHHVANLDSTKHYLNQMGVHLEPASTILSTPFEFKIQDEEDTGEDILSNTVSPTATINFELHDTVVHGYVPWDAITPDMSFDAFASTAPLYTIQEQRGSPRTVQLPARPNVSQPPYHSNHPGHQYDDLRLSIQQSPQHLHHQYQQQLYYQRLYHERQQQQYSSSQKSSDAHP